MNLKTTLMAALILTPGLTMAGGMGSLDWQDVWDNAKQNANQSQTQNTPEVPQTPVIPTVTPSTPQAPALPNVPFYLYPNYDSDRAQEKADIPFTPHSGNEPNSLDGDLGGKSKLMRMRGVQ